MLMAVPSQLADWLLAGPGLAGQRPGLRTDAAAGRGGTARAGAGGAARGRGNLLHRALLVQSRWVAAGLLRKARSARAAAGAAPQGRWGICKQQWRREALPSAGWWRRPGELPRAAASFAAAAARGFAARHSALGASVDEVSQPGRAVAARF
jgi:hypothetical protein